MLVVDDRGVATFELPQDAEVVIGRAPDCTISLDDPHISRRHVSLRVGRTIEITDLGGRNGTKLRGERLRPGEPTRAFPNDTLVFGSTIATLQPVGSSSVGRRHHVWSLEYFDAHVKGECERATERPAQFALMSVKYAKPEQVRGDVVRVVLSGFLGPRDVIAAGARDEYRLLFDGVDPTRAHSCSRALKAQLATLGVEVEIATACFPSDGTTAGKLLATLGATGRSESACPPLSPRALDRILPLVNRVAVGTISILIQGETGSGKEVLAHSIHARSPRAPRPMLCLNCAAFAPNLLEGELFGYERGAFTGATQAKPGLLETADGGTIFLDEIGEMPPELQAKLLRVIEQRQVTRLGALKPRSIDVRFISASHRDLEDEVDRGAFREDLYFRLAGVTVTVPPLRDRMDELDGLIQRFTEQFAAQAGYRAPPRVTPEALDRLRGYSWPGNIRELRNVIECAVLLCGGAPITREHLPEDKMDRAMRRRRESTSSAPILPPTAPTLPVAVVSEHDDGASEQSERQRVEMALARCAGNQTQAAKLLGMTRRALVYRIEQYGLVRPRRRAPS